LWRDSEFAIYKQSNKRFEKCWYESIQIKKQNGFKIGDYVYGPREMYPPSEKWGLLGFTYGNIDDAKKRIERMKSENKK
jgi:hypothetical protein